MVRANASTRWPTNPADLGAAMADPARFAEIFPESSPQAWEDFAEAYAAASPVIAELRQLELQAGLRAAGDSRPPRMAGMAGSVPGRTRFYNRHAPGVSTEGILPAGDFPLARFVRTIHPGNDGGMEDRVRLGNAMSERVPSEGGFLVPENLRSDLLALVLERSVIRPRARVVPMDSLRVPYPAIDDVSHESTVFGGVQAFWTEEGASLAATGPSFERVVLEAKKLTAFTSIPNELLQDQSAQLLDEFLSSQLPAAVAWFEDTGFISGTGVGEPQGFLNSPAAVTVTALNAHVIVFADIAAAFARMLPTSMRTAVWLCAPDVLPQLLMLAMTAGTGPNGIAPPLWLQGMQATDTPGGGSGDGVSYMLMGRPLIVTEKMPACGSSNTTVPGALSLVDLQQYLLGDRQTIQSAVSSEYLFGQDMTAYRWIERCDGRVWMQSPLQPQNGGPTLSPVVLIDTTG